MGLFSFFSKNNKDEKKKKSVVKKIPVPDVDTFNKSTGWIEIEFDGKKYTVLQETAKFMVSQMKRHEMDLEKPEYRSYLIDRVLDMERVYEQELIKKLRTLVPPDQILHCSFFLDSMSTSGWLDQRNGDSFFTLDVKATGIDMEGRRVKLDGYSVLQDGDIMSVEFPKIVIAGKQFGCSLRLLYGEDRRIAVLRYPDFDIVLDEENTNSLFGMTDVFLSRFVAVHRSVPRHVAFRPEQKYFSMKICVPYAVTDKDAVYYRNDRTPVKRMLSGRLCFG